MDNRSKLILHVSSVALAFWTILGDVTLSLTVEAAAVSTSSSLEMWSIFPWPTTSSHWRSIVTHVLPAGVIPVVVSTSGTAATHSTPIGIIISIVVSHVGTITTFRAALVSLASVKPLWWIEITASISIVHLIISITVAPHRAWAHAGSTISTTVISVGSIRSTSRSGSTSHGTTVKGS